MIRCAIRENESMTLRRFCKGLNDDLRKEVVFQGVSTLNQAYTLVQNYKLVTKNQWMNRQGSYSIHTRSQFRSSDSLLGALPHRPNPSSAQLCKKDKGK
jgi:predicted N-acyltransferase